MQEISASFNQINAIGRNFINSFPNLRKFNLLLNNCVNSNLEIFQSLIVGLVHKECYGNYDESVLATNIRPASSRQENALRLPMILLFYQH